MQREAIAVHFGETWVDFMAPFLQSEEWPKITQKLKEDKEAGKIIYPIPQQQMFRAFRETPLNKLRIVIIGMDPYPREGYANGLAFAHLNNMKTAPSLEKIIDAVEADAYNGLKFDKNNFNKELTHWTAQGILLLNASLSVVDGKPGAHAEVWKPFTSYVLKTLNEVKRDVIVLAWGKDAQALTTPLNPITNFLFSTEHPAAAARESRKWNCNHFSLTNAVITGNRLGDTIKW